ncbi:perforin-1-like isoform X2 [Leptotrombidium deliense]|uniref:Perforin-1-like isoform X2 n=1 Tax=Leptotrombidium deliense TaxID=299467 RepID=A0A443SCK3_9ACAR|nr:perforin-1-like isoform X2 [Leptotrombidium deliense]
MANLVLCFLLFNVCWTLTAAFANTEGKAEIIVEQAHVPRETGLFAGSRDSYVRVYVDGSYIGKTRVIDDTHTPVWNERFDSGYIKKSSKIRFSLWDKDYLESDDFMGSMTVTPQEVLRDNMNATSHVRHFPHGFVQFKLTWFPCPNDVCFEK